MKKFLILMVLALAVAHAAWPRTPRLRQFDPVRAAHLETKMWRYYYEHDYPLLFLALYSTNRNVYGFSPWDSARLAWEAGSAARAFQPTRSRAEAAVAQPRLENYFEIIRVRSGERFDPNDLARRELDWWQLRRENAPPERYGAVVAQVSAGMFGNDNADVRQAALRRAQMMRYRDERRNGKMKRADWAHIESGLVESYRLLKAGIGGGPDAPPPYRAAAPLPEPTLFAEGIVSTGEFESHPGFTPDGRTLYFVRSTPQFSDWKIWVTQYGDSGWTKPVLAPFSGTYRDADPFITSDGAHLYFISDRPMDDTTRADMDIWMMDRAGDGSWGAPRNVGAPINSSGSEWYPTIATDGSLYFGSDRPGGLGATDLYRARPLGGGGFGEPENLGKGVNSAADEYEPRVAPDGSFLVFMAAGRPDSPNGGDLYLSRLVDGDWHSARNLGPVINRPAPEIAPTFSPDGRYFFFSSCRREKGQVPGERPNRARNGLGDIYQMDVEALVALAGVDSLGH